MLLDDFDMSVSFFVASLEINYYILLVPSQEFERSIGSGHFDIRTD
ncbi:Unknown protein sequence [Pseudomonas savastanoi pv. phaseolicola]|nr:Unknown protein sequence [Pseudomonas savastanoi pv. phaseolicola]